MNSCGDPEQDSKKIADLLKYGAHSLVSCLNHLGTHHSCFLVSPELLDPVDPLMLL